MMANGVARAKRAWADPRQRWAGIALLAWLPIFAAVPALVVQGPHAVRSAAAIPAPIVAPISAPQSATTPNQDTAWETGTVGGLKLTTVDNPFGEAWPRFSWKNHRGGSSGNARQWAPPARLGISPAIMGYRTVDGRKSGPTSRSGMQAGQAVASTQQTFRTFCVRLCDGFLTPISFATTRDRLRQDAKTCETTCGSPARMFYHANPGGEQADMVDLDGNRYDALEFAYLYRTKYVHSCQCKPLPWSATEQFRHASYAEAAAKLVKRSRPVSGQRRWTRADRRALREKLRDVAAVGVPISKADAERMVVAVSTQSASQPKSAAEPEVWPIGGRRVRLGAIVPPAPRRVLLAAGERAAAAGERAAAANGAGASYRPMVGAAVFSPAVLAAGAFQSIPWEFISARAVPTAHHITMPSAVAY